MISTAERIKTNWLLIDDLGMWDEFIIKKNDEKHIKDYYSELEDIIDKQLQAGVNWLDSPEAKRFFYNEAEYKKDVFKSLENEWDKIINGKYKTIDELLDEFYNTGKQKGYSDIRNRIRFTEADRLALTFAKNYNFHLIRKLSNDLRSNVKNKIIKSAIGGENPNKLANELLKLGIKPLPNMTLSAKQRAVMIAKTETSRIQNTGILQSYVNEGYTEVTILTAEDDDVCYTCLRYAYEFNKDSPVVYGNRGDDRTHNIRTLLDKGVYPPFHPNCRCTVLPVWETKGNPPENPFTVNLTPITFDELIDLAFNEFKSWNDFKSKEDLERLKSLEGWKPLDEDDIPDYIPKTLKENMLSFEEQRENFDDGNEWAQVCNLTTGDVYGIMTNHKSDCVAPFKDKDFRDDDVAMVHNHQDGTFLSPDDFTSGFYNRNNIKYVVVHTDNYIYIAKFNHIPKTDKEYDLFIEEYNKIRASSSPGECWIKFNSNPITSKYISVDMVVKV